jgi:hypothetical protein
MGFENGKLVRVTLEATLGDRSEVNTFHYDLVDGALGATPNDPQTLADLFRDNVRPAWAARYRSRWTIAPVVVVMERDPLHPTDPRSEWSSGAAITGTRATGSDLLPSACAFVVSLKSDHIGRRFNGRLFLGGDQDEGAQSDGVWVAGAITEAESFVATIPRQPDLATGPSSSVANWCIYSRTQRAANLDPYASAITSHVNRAAVHWRRKRANIL